MKIVRLIAALLLATPASGAAIVDVAVPQGSAASISTEHRSSRVELSIANNQSNSVGGRGFVLSIEGWEPNGHLSIYLVGPKGERVAVVPMEHQVQIKGDGLATFAVPYKLRGLYPGQWQLIVAGESGIHMATVVIPAADGT